MSCVALPGCELWVMPPNTYEAVEKCKQYYQTECSPENPPAKNASFCPSINVIPSIPTTTRPSDDDDDDDLHDYETHMRYGST